MKKLSIGILLRRFALVGTATLTISACSHGDPTASEPFELDASIAVGSYGNCAVKAAALYCWGSNTDNVLGIPGSPLDDVNEPTRVSGAGTAVVDVEMGYANMCALTKAKGLQCWGSNTVGQLGNGTYEPVGASQREDASEPASPASLAGRVQQFSIGGATVCAIAGDSRAYCWGAGENGELGNGGFTSSLTAVEVTGVESAEQIAVGVRTACSINSGAEVYCWGKDLTTEANGAVNPVPIHVSALDGSGYISLDSSSDTGCAINKSRKAICWGNNYEQVITEERGTTHAAYTEVASSHRFRMVDVDSTHICGVDESNELYCWGANDSGETSPGGPSYISPLSPAKVELGQEVVDVSVGSQITCATLADQTFMCWGKNNSNSISPYYPSDAVLPPTVQDIS
ncbi:RCC1 domain-containing protein [Nocardia cyriacigeorgica]|uniref:RCC1 domain-containing protein n=1 Tax=Nocardia cyriacigeorgica TaxID=135487 RepID=UPI0024560792|nr:hypothetical protein [Nocardia cyriacigeorgica]